MKIKEGYAVRQMGEQYIVVALDNEMDEYNGMITLNNSGYYIWNKLKNDIPYDDLLSDLTEKYDAPVEVIKADLDAFLENAKRVNILE
ncbi:MAG: PqqD family protein [Ruminococcus sp.]